MKLDIMLPHYGDSTLMKAAVHSIIGQTDTDWRLTVVDDGQEPGLPEWFDELDDNRVRYLRNPHNLGITGNFQRCVDLAEAEYMTLMGADDLMLPNYLETVREVRTEYPGVAIVQPGVEVIDAGGRVTSTLVDQMKRRLYAPRVTARKLMGGEELATSLLRGNWLYFPSLCWRTEAIKRVRFRPELRVIQDLALIIELVLQGEQLVVDPTLCFRYRRHTVSVSSADARTGARFIEARGYFLDVADEMRAHGWPRAARAARRYLSSRLHACTMLPAAIRYRQSAGIRTLTRHAFGPSRR